MIELRSTNVFFFLLADVCLLVFIQSVSELFKTLFQEPGQIYQPIETHMM